MSMVISRLHKASFKPSFQDILSLPEIKYGMSVVNNDLDRWEKNRKSQQDANKK